MGRGGDGLPVVFVLDDPLVPLQLILKRRLVHGKVATFTGELLQGPLSFLDLLPQRFDLLVVHLDLVIVALLCVFDGLLQRISLKEETRAGINEEVFFFLIEAPLGCH